MKSTIEFSPAYTMLTLQLDPGESFKAEPGAMVAQQGVEMQTGMGGGGLFGGFKRMMGGESFFVNTFTAGNFGGWVSISPPSPGDIHSQDLRPGENLFLQGSSFLACTENVQTDTQFQGLKGVFSGGEHLLPAGVRSGSRGDRFLRFLRGHQAAGRGQRRGAGGGYGPRGGLHRRRGVLHWQGGGHALPTSGRGRTGDEVQGSRPGVDSEQEHREPGA